MLIDMNTVDRLIAMAEQQVRNVLLIMRQPLMPTWVFIDSANQPHICATPWQDDHEKRLAEVAMRLQMRQHKARAYSFIVEAWAAMAPEGWDPTTRVPEKDRPINRADRQEVVIAFATDGHKAEWRRWNIRRDWNEQIIALEAASEDEEGCPEGWMADLLK